VRYWIPALAAVVCLVVASVVASPLIGFVLVIAALGFVLDASTKWFETARKAGGLGDHRQ
jgi:uncharacterized membrane protein